MSIEQGPSRKTNKIEKPKRPGGPLERKPIQGLDGQWYNQFGEKIPPPDTSPQATIDQIYAKKYWDKYPDERVKEAMSEIIELAAKTGVFRHFVSANGITEEDKVKLSAYRQLAHELGYKLGQFKFNKNSHSVYTEIHKA